MDTAESLQKKILQDQKTEQAIHSEEGEAADGDERLSVFQDFLEGLDLDDIDTEEDDSSEK